MSKQFRLTFGMTSFLSVILLSLPSFATTDFKSSFGSRCHSLLNRVVSDQDREAIRGYLRDMERTRGARLILAPPEGPSETRMGGVLTREEYDQVRPSGVVSGASYALFDAVPRGLGRLLTREANWRLTPLRPVERILMDVPTEVATRELLYTRRRPSLLVKTGVYVWLTMMGWNVFLGHANNELDHTADRYQIADMAENSDVYLQSIEGEYIYRPIKRRLETKPDFTTEDALKQAQTLSIGIRAYKKLVEEHGIPSDLSNLPQTLDQQLNLYGSSPYFLDLWFYMEKPLGSDGFVHAKNQGLATDMQVLDMYALTHSYLAQLIYLDEAFVSGARILKQTRQLEVNRGHVPVTYQMIFDDPIMRDLFRVFDQPLRQPRAQGSFEKMRLFKSIAQEFISNRRHFEIFKVLELEPLLDPSQPYSESNVMTWEYRRKQLCQGFNQRITELNLPSLSCY